MYNGQADYWWLRSPDLYDVSFNAYCVESGGYAVSSSNWDFTYSYGRSPNCTSDSNACYVISDGVVYYGVGNDVYWDSCGRRSPDLDSYGGSACLVYSGGVVNVSGWGVADSYGIK